MSAPVGSMGGSGWEIRGEKRHDESFYSEHRQRRDDAIARGEDPYAGYKKQVAERQSASHSGGLLGKLIGKGGSSGSKTTATKEKNDSEKVAQKKDGEKVAT
ncbi:hypothetical protein TruAng_008789 [Truncatella angustata]|nr:hypothetical protein TruAng_008789 [Truncatella angustata]